MKRILSCAALGLAVLIPNAAFAQGYYGYHHHEGPIGVVGDLVALPFVAAGAVLSTAATVATLPFYAADGYAQQAPAYYQQPAYYAPPAAAYYQQPAYAPRAYYAPQPVYYAAPPRAYYAAPAPAYYAPRVVYQQPYYPPAPAY